MNRHDVVAAGLADAMLAGTWNRRGLLRRCRSALGAGSPPLWLAPLVDEVLAAYDLPPWDRPAELAGYLKTRPTWRDAWRPVFATPPAQRDTRPSSFTPPRITERTPVVTELVRRPWPITVLPDLAALARLLDLDQGELAWFADVRGLERTAPEPLRHYRWRVVPKRGGVRLLAAPKPRLKEIQRRVLRHVLTSIPLHAAAHGGVPGRSVRTALEPHAGRPVVLRADLATFFGSVPAARVWGVLCCAGLPEPVAHVLTGLLTTVVPLEVERTLPRGERDRRLREPHLPQGAPTSTALANLVAFTLDRRLAGLAARFDASYTRYVDDLVFSGGAALRASTGRLLARVGDVARAEGFALNERKSVVLAAAGRQQVLGGVVNVAPAVPRRERDELRALLHNCAIRGWRSQAGGRDDFPGWVRGRIAWVHALHPQHGERLLAAYREIDWSAP